jgi:hypothetical protein
MAVEWHAIKSRASEINEGNCAKQALVRILLCR